MRVFLTGASGFIGSAVARAFASAGHDVAGLVRSAAKARALEALEVAAVVGDMEDTARWADALRDASVLIHAASDASGKHWDLDARATDELLRAASAANTPRTVVYTSGVWLYGSTGSRLVDESSPLAPIEIVKPRVLIEGRVLFAHGGALRTIVIRPGCVYGGGGSLTAAWFQSGEKGERARVVGTGRERWAMVHVEDLADLYVRAVESDHGGVFNATDRSRFTVHECARAAMAAAGAKGDPEVVPVETARVDMGGFAEALALDQNVDARRAVRLLGWQPRHGGFVDGAARYYRAWRASRS